MKRLCFLGRVHGLGVQEAQVLHLGERLRFGHVHEVYGMELARTNREGQSKKEVACNASPLFKKEGAS